ncbi:MAG: DUF885 domain-containing protein, partial [bacterium]|nr:DUF885 domain-containing protein [Candidatus Aquidulcis frankliniae]
MIDALDATGLLARFAALHPVAATGMGIHDYDGSWGQQGPAGRAARLAWCDSEEARLVAAPVSSLSPDDLCDRDLALGTIRAIRFELQEVQPEAWDALHTVSVIGGGLFPLIARGFGTAERRASDLASRLTAVPDLLEAAIVDLTGLPELRVPADDGAPRRGGDLPPAGTITLPARPVSRLHVETAIAQAPGIAELAELAVATYGEALRAPADAAAAATTRFIERLQREVLPKSSGEGRYGAALYDRALRHTLFGSHDRAAIAAKGEQEFAAVRQRMISIAQRIAPEWLGERATAALNGDQSTLVAEVLHAIGGDHCAPEEMLDRSRAETARCEAFVRKTGLVDLPKEPLEIMWTPLFLRAYGGAFLDAPGPLDRGEKSFFYVTPAPDDATPEQIESKMREDNNRMLALLAIHEAIPGHYLQLAAANQTPRPLRAAFGSGVFAEGWAVYVTQVMLDEGFGDGDLALELVHWKFYLRCIANALLDAGIHADG